MAVALAIAAGEPGVAAPRGRAGKVVRVDRPRAIARSVPRVCQLAPRELRGQCFGPEPTVGELAAVLDDRGVLAHLRVASVHDSRDSCGNVSLWDVTYTLVRGD